VYFTNAIQTLIQFGMLLYQNVYVLDIEEIFRVKVIIRGFLVFTGQTLLITGIKMISDVSTPLILMICLQTVVNFFLIKSERQKTNNIVGMCLSLISLIMFFIQLVQPSGQYSLSNVMSTDQLVFFCIAASSGICLGFVNYLNKKTT
jgi:hypothetical protein